MGHEKSNEENSNVGPRIRYSSFFISLSNSPIDNPASDYHEHLQYAQKSKKNTS